MSGTTNRHYRVGPGKCACGFNAYHFTGIMLDYHELLMAHLREAPKRDKEAIATRQRLGILRPEDV